MKELSSQMKALSETIAKKNMLSVYSNKDVMEMLQVNTVTLRRYRDNGLISFSKVGDKYFYTAEDINKFLRNSHKEAFGWRTK